MASGDAAVEPHKRNLLFGILPFIGIILFVIAAVQILFGPHDAEWERQLVEAGVVYMIGWAGIGAGLSHLIFSRPTARSIGWEPSPFQREVGFANLGFGVAGVLAASYGHEYWLAVIIASAVFLVGCGAGHVSEMVRTRNFAVNNSLVLVNDFGVPAVLFLMYFAWAA